MIFSIAAASYAARDGEYPRDLWKASRGMYWLNLSWKKVILGHAVWISSKPLSEEMAELVHHFLEMVELPKEKVKMESKGWAIEVVVARSLDWRVLVEAVAHKFQQ